MAQTKQLLVLHFNDVYNIADNDLEPVSGASRLAGLIHSLSDEQPLVLFSGDAFSPSSFSTITLGQHMPPVLNTMNIKACCIGNHDFDLGLATAQALVRQCNFPWLFSNVKDRDTGETIPGLHETVMLEHQGVKIGLMGLVEQEWLETLPTLDPDTLLYADFVSEGERLAAELRARGAELVIALTHMRVPNDRKLAASVPGIDLVLGGHDHHYEVDYIQPHGTLMVKSGTDFRDMTRVDVELGGPGGRVKATWERLSIARDTPRHQPTVDVVRSFESRVGSALEQVIGFTTSDMDARFEVIRSAESNMGNLVCDVLRAATRADMVVVNAGTLRSDMVHRAGPFRLKDLISLLPMDDLLITCRATGHQVLQVLENGVSQVPRLEGRFPQLSGVSFKFDSRKPAGHRVVPGSVMVLARQGSAPDGLTRTGSKFMTLGRLLSRKASSECGEETWQPLELDRSYVLGVKSYMHGGKDGYDVLTECPILMGDEAGLSLPQAIRNHFRSLKVLNAFDPKARAMAATLRAARAWQRNVRAKKAGQRLTRPPLPPGAAPGAVAGASTASSSAPEEGRSKADEEEEGQEEDPCVVLAAQEVRAARQSRQHSLASAGSLGSANSAGTLPAAAAAARAASGGGAQGGGGGGPFAAAAGTAIERGRMSSSSGQAHLALRTMSSLPARSRLFAASSGLCVLSPFGYAVHPVVEGRIVDVAALGSVQEEAA